jgi:hypothetical protein
MKSTLIRQCILVAAGALLLQSAPVLADKAPPPVGAPGNSRNFDWVQHTQRTIDELKGKLNLAPGQMAAWGTWSGGVMNDARQQIERMKAWHEKVGEEKPSFDVTTPERMARGIERLRAETSEMQEHLVRLEAAQVRTKVFYDKLDTNQKTIFDLYWHKVHHRDVGYGHGMHEGFGPSPMRGERGDTASEY